MTRACLLALLPTAAAFYLPGVAPRDYQPSERVDLKVCVTGRSLNFFSLIFFSVSLTRTGEQADIDEDPASI